MPEGHLVHRTARAQRDLVGCEITVTSPQGRFAAEAKQLDGRRLREVRAHGEHLLLRFDGGATVHVDLGVRGLWLRHEGRIGPAKRQVRLRLRAEATSTAWDLIAPMTCELLDDDAVTALDGRLGPDPLDPYADSAQARHNLKSSDTIIGEALLDQRLLSGVGTVLRSEALVRARLHPGTPAADLDAAQLADLWQILQRLMCDAVEAGEIRPKLVHKRGRCGQCDQGTVEELPLAGRIASVCPVCQPRSAELSAAA